MSAVVQLASNLRDVAADGLDLLLEGLGGGLDVHVSLSFTHCMSSFNVSFVFSSGFVTRFVHPMAPKTTAMLRTTPATTKAAPCNNRCHNRAQERGQQMHS